MSRQNPSYSGQPRRSTGSSTHHKSSRKQYTMYREPPEKDPKPRRRRSTDGVTAAQLSKFIVPALLAHASRKRFGSPQFRVWGGTPMIVLILLFGLGNAVVHILSSVNLLPVYQ